MRLLVVRGSELDVDLLAHTRSHHSFLIKVDFELRCAGREDVNALWVVGVINDFDFLHSGAACFKAIKIHNRRYCLEETIGTNCVVTIYRKR